MNAEQIEKLREVMENYKANPHDAAAIGKWHGAIIQAGPALVELAERSTADVSALTDEKIIQRFESHINTDPDCFDLQDGDCAYWIKQSEMINFARVLLAAAPAPIQQEPIYYSITHKGHHCNNIVRNMEYAESEMARLNRMYPDGDRAIVPLYTAPPALAGSQSQAAGDSGKVQAIKAAVSAIYFDDNSDYGTALWEVVQVLDPAMAKLLEENPSAAYSQADAAAMREQS